MFDSYLSESILGRAIKNKKISVSFVNPRKFVSGKYKKVWPDGNVSSQIDERPYGGGPGMVMMAEPIIKAILFVTKKIERKKTKDGAAKKILVINFTPRAKKFETKMAKDFSNKYEDIILICGRYEGVDARVGKIIKSAGYKVVDISIGDYVLTGGEIPAMTVIDSTSRQVVGVLGNFDSREEERVSSALVYTRPEVITFADKKYKVPKVLLSGNHKKIDGWKTKK